MHTTRVFVVDDHPLVREAVRHCVARAPDLEFAGESDGTGDVCTLVAVMQPHVVIVDYRLPVVTGDVLAGELKKIEPSIRILGISSDVEAARQDMLAAGADAFLGKIEVGLDRMTAAIRALSAGG